MIDSQWIVAITASFVIILLLFWLTAWQQLFLEPLPSGHNRQLVDCSLSLPLHHNTSWLIVTLAPFE